MAQFVIVVGAEKQERLGLAGDPVVVTVPAVNESVGPYCPRVRVMPLPAASGSSAQMASHCVLTVASGITKQLCPCWMTRFPAVFGTIVHVVGATVTVVEEPLVLFVSFSVHFETPSVVAVGRVVATDTLP